MPALTTIWKTSRGTTWPTALVSMTATNTPSDGEPVYVEASGHTYQFMPTTPGSATAAQRTIAGICIWGSNPLGALYNPGIVAASAATGVAALNIGGRGSRASSTTPTYQRFLAPVSAQDEWVMTRRTATAITLLDTGYAFYRAGTSDYYLDQGNAQSVLLATGYYSPDIDKGLPVSSGTSADLVARVWTKAILPGGDI